MGERGMCDVCGEPLLTIPSRGDQAIFVTEDGRWMHDSCRGVIAREPEGVLAALACPRCATAEAEREQLRTALHDRTAMYDATEAELADALAERERLRDQYGALYDERRDQVATMEWEAERMHKRFTVTCDELRAERDAALARVAELTEAARECLSPCDMAPKGKRGWCLNHHENGPCPFEALRVMLDE